MVAAIALFCDDIREEKAGTVSVIGIYPDNITVQKAPLMLPKCGIYVRLNIRLEETPPERISLRLVHADGTEFPLTTFNVEMMEKARAESQAMGAANAGLISTALLAPFPIKQLGRINVVVKIDNEESVCGTLNVQVIGP
jgi:hypothetical protein